MSCTVNFWTFSALDYNHQVRIFLSFFLTLFSKVKKCLRIQFDCLYVHALTLLNILQMSYNSCMLFISDTEWTVLKVVCMGLMVYLQSFPMHYGLRGRKPNRTLTCLYYVKYNEINICHSDVQKYVSYHRSHNKILIYYRLCSETTEKVFSMCFVVYISIIFKV